MDDGLKKRALVLVLGAVLLSGCRLEIEVPEGGVVQSESGAFFCASGQACSIDVVDQYFDETFVAVAGDGNTFLGWDTGKGTFCGDSLQPCQLSTAGFAAYPALVRVLASDDAFYLRPRFLFNPRLQREDLATQGEETPTAGGFRLQGSLGLTPDVQPGSMLTDADLDLRFDGEGELLSMAGSALLPQQVTDYVGVIGSSRAQLGLYTGAELNADKAVGIHLIDERQYLLFLLSSGVDLEIGDRAGGSDVVTVETPLGGTVIMILDPADEMIYRYGSILGETQGRAESDQGLLPYVPLVDVPGARSFFAHRYETGEKSVGIKVFDVLNFSGEYLVREPGFADIDLADPFNSEVGYMAGFNGHAEVAFGVLGFGLFEFDLAEASASFSVQPLLDLDRQRVSVYARVAPDVSWQPAWFPILPTTALEAEFSANAAGELNAKLSGDYHSVLPEAELHGLVRMNERAVAMFARVAGPELDFPVQIVFRDGETHALVNLGAEIGEYIRGGMDSAFDDVDRQIDQALHDLDAAAENYEFELSLRGARAVIPTITGEAISRLQAIPGDVYSSVRSQVISEINARRYCFLGACTPSDSKRDSIASSAASDARSQANSAIAPYVAAMEELRDRAAEEDDDAVREALRLALLAAYDHRHIDRTISVSVSVDIVIDTIVVSKSYSINRDVLTSAQAAEILAAADNIHLIPEASEQVVNAGALVDALPLEEAVQAAREEVANGLDQLPGLASLGYDVIDGEYAGVVRFSTGEEYRVDFNVLDPVEAVAGINLLAVEYVIAN